MAKLTLTSKDVDRITMLSKGCKSFAQLVALVGVAPATLRRFMINFGIDYNKRPTGHAQLKHLSSYENAILLKMANSGVSVSTMADRFNVNFTTIKRLLGEIGIHNYQRDNKYNDVWTEQTVAKLKELYVTGIASSQIARQLGDKFTRNMVLGKLHRLFESGELTRLTKSTASERAIKSRLKTAAVRKQVDEAIKERKPAKVKEPKPVKIRERKPAKVKEPKPVKIKEQKPDKTLKSRLYKAGNIEALS